MIQILLKCNLTGLSILIKFSFILCYFNCPGLATAFLTHPAHIHTPITINPSLFLSVSLFSLAHLSGMYSISLKEVRNWALPRVHLLFLAYSELKSPCEPWTPFLQVPPSSWPHSHPCHSWTVPLSPQCASCPWMIFFHYTVYVVLLYANTSISPKTKCPPVQSFSTDSLAFSLLKCFIWIRDFKCF